MGTIHDLNFSNMTVDVRATAHEQLARAIKANGRAAEALANALNHPNNAVGIKIIAEPDNIQQAPEAPNVKRKK